ncbi:MAG: diacylglycerol kinase [Bacteroidetes bacterium]|nr:diacylglycerol kinase [Bacteroidota bacterium]
MKLIKSFGYACQGIIIATREQLNIKIHLLAVIVVTAAGWYYHITSAEWCWVVLCFGMVLSAELFNSAIENLVDLVSPGHHHIAGKVKDIAAGAVLVTAIGAGVIALLIFKKYIIGV